MATETKQVQGRLVYIEPNDLASMGPNGEPVDNITWNPEDLNMSVDLQVIVPSRTGNASFNINDKTKFAINMTYDTNTDIGRFVSFMQGATINKGDGTTAVQGELTTDYIEASYTELYKDGKSSKECLGIDSVDITFDSHFYPQVTIKFIDVRGYSLMMPTEEQYRATMLYEKAKKDPNVDLSSVREPNSYSNFFRALFHFPYPRFLLSIKGFYGTAITFMLAVNEFKTNFNSQTGNFEVTVTFIGYMYGLYTDLPFNFLIAAPYCNGQSNDGTTNGYWNNDNFKYDDGKNQKINTFIEFIENFTHYQGDMASARRGQGNYESFDDLQKTNDKIDALNNLCKNIDDFFDTLTNGNAYTLNGTQIKFYPVSNNIDGGNDYISEEYDIISGDSNGVDANSVNMTIFGKDGTLLGMPKPDDKIIQLWDTFVDAYIKYTNKYKDPIDCSMWTWTPPNFFNSVSETKGWDKHDNLVSVYTYSKVNYYIGYYEGNKKLAGISKNNLEKLPVFGQLSQTGKGKVVFCLLPSTIKAPFKAKIKELEEQKSALQQQTTIETKEIYNQNFCFEPTIVNVYRMIFAHMNCFMDIFYDTIDKIKSLGRTVETMTGLPEIGLTDLNKGTKEKDIVPPFPAIYKEVDNRREQVYPGEIRELATGGLMPEIKLVEDLIMGAMGAKNKVNQIALQGVERETANQERYNNTNFNIIKISDILYMNEDDNGRNPYSYTHPENADEPLGEILYIFTTRLIAALAEQKKPEAIKEGDINEIMEVEVSNFVKAYQNKYESLDKNLNKDGIDYFETLQKYLKNKNYHQSGNTSALTIQIDTNDKDSFYLVNGEHIYNLPLMLTGSLDFKENNKNSISKNKSLQIVNTKNPHRFDILTIKKTAIKGESNNEIISILNDTINELPQKVYNQNTDSHGNIFTIFPNGEIPTDEDHIDGEGWYMEDKINEHKKNSYKDYRDNIWADKTIWPFKEEIDQDKYLLYFLFVFVRYTFATDIQHTTIRVIDKNSSCIRLLNYATACFVGVLLKFSKDNTLKKLLGGEVKDGKYYLTEYTGSMVNERGTVITERYVIDGAPQDYSSYSKEAFINIYNEFVRNYGKKIYNTLTAKESYSEYSRFPDTCYGLTKEALSSIFSIFFNMESKEDILDDKTVFAQYVSSPSLNAKVSDYHIPVKVLENFCNLLNAAYETQNTIYDAYNNQEILKSQVTNAYRLSMYNSLKNLYDKWLTTYDRSNFKLNSPSVDRQNKKERYQEGKISENATCEYDNFIFVDCFFRDISHKFFINPETLFNVIQKQMTTENNFSVYQFMAQLMQDNHMLLQALPVYNNFYNLNTLERVFKPNIKDTLKTGFGSTYVCMYTYEVSHIIEDDRQSDHIADDGIDLCDITGNPLPLEGHVASMLFDKMGNDNELNITVPAFGVTYARQNQTYFTNIDVNMDNPRVTDYSIANLFSLANMSKDKEIDEVHSIGNDIYAIYANRSYNCGVEMMGCANIMPMMYFQLNNIPMFRGAYMITSVEHHIKAGDFKTQFRGVRINKNQLPYNQEALTTDNIWGYQMGDWGTGVMQYAPTMFAPSVKVTNPPDFNITKSNNANEYHLVLWRYNRVLSRGDHYAIEGVIYELDTNKILTYTIEDEYDVTRNNETWSNGDDIDTTITPGGGTWPGQNKPYHWGCSLYCATLANGRGGFGTEAKKPLTMLKVGNKGCLFHPGADVTWSEGCILCGEQAQNGKRKVSSVQYHMENIFSSTNNDVLWWRNIYDNVVPKICEGKKVILHVRKKIDTLETTQISPARKNENIATSTIDELVSMQEKIAKAGLSQYVIINPIYATTKNFGGRVMPGYVSGQQDLYLGKNTMKQFIKAVQYMKQKYPDKKLMIWDAYRPYEAADNFCKIAKETGHSEWLGKYIANISGCQHSKSPHCKGKAIDLTLCNSSGQPLRMIPDGKTYTCSWATATGGFDEFSSLANVDKTHPNQKILRDIMMEGGKFSDYKSEYWHFQTGLDTCDGSTNYK